MSLKNKSLNSILISFYLIITTTILVSTSVFALNFFNYNLKKASNELVFETGSQISYNYEAFIDNIIDISINIEDKFKKDENYNQDNIQSLFDSILFAEENLTSIQIFDQDGNLLSKDKNSTSLIAKDKKWFIKTLEDRTIHHFTVERRNSEYILFSKAITLIKSNTTIVLTMEFSLKDMLNIGDKTSLGYGGHILIVDKDNNVVQHSSNDLDNIDEEINLITTTIIGNCEYQYNKHHYSVWINTLADTNWRIAIFYNIDSFQNMTLNYMVIFFSIILSIAIVSCVLFFFLSKQISKPLKQLEENMRKINLDSPKNIVLNGGTKEIISLNNSYNNMIDHISNLYNQVLLEQTNQRKSELKALQNQINPHFLYNTLDSIVWLIDNDQKEDAQRMILALSKLFRISISRGNNIIPVKDEIEHVKNYLYIQKMRYKDSFDYDIQIDEQCYKYKVMKLILQPIVENSIYHGLKNKIDTGSILIKGYMENNNLIISVKDNGYGISQDTIEDLYKKFNNPNLNDGVGLKNVYQRLRLYYGDNAFLKIISEVDEYTEILISVPLEDL